MSFRGRGGGFGGGRNSFGGGGRGGGRNSFGGGGRNSFGGRGGGRGYDDGPPETVIPLGFFTHPCEGDLVCKAEIEDVPFFNAPIYSENKQQIGKIDEIFGNIRDYYVSVRLGENMQASSFKRNQKIFIDPAKLLPLKRFLPLPPGSVQKKRGRGGGGGGRGRGGRGGGGGGRGGGGFGRGGFGGGRGRGGGGFGRGGFGGGGGGGRGGGFNRGGRGGGGGRW